MGRRYTPPTKSRLDIRRRGRSWKGDEAIDRFNLTEDLKFEMIHGKLFWTRATRLDILALLLENVGADAAVRLGDLEVWKAAVAAAEADSARGGC